MKKIFRNIILAAAAVVSAAGCQTEELVQINPDDVIAPVLHDPGFPEVITITPSNQSEEICFTWDAAHVGFGAQLNYAVEMFVEEGGKMAALSGGVASTTTTVKYEDINYSLVYGLGAIPLEPVNVKFCLSAAVGVRKFYSEPIAVNIVPTNAAKQFPHIYFVGSYCGWNHTEAQLMYDYSENGLKYQAVIDFGKDYMTSTSGGFKLTPEGNWNGEWAEPAAWTDEYKAQVADGTLEKDLEEVEFATGGGDCLRYSESHRFYHFSLSTETNTFSMEAAFDAAKLVFDGEEIDLTFHDAKHSQYFYADVVVKTGSKFYLSLLSKENDTLKETMALGADDADTEGILIVPEDGAVKEVTVPEDPGNYRIYINMNDWSAVIYEFDMEKFGTEEGSGAVVETYKGWGICGYMNNWKGDVPMTFNEQTRWWEAKKVHLEYDYEFHFRKDGASAIVFKGGGFAKNKATMQKRDGDNIIVGESGYYDIYLDATNGCCWFCTPGQTPDKEASPVRPDGCADWSVCGSITDWSGEGAAAGTVPDIWMTNVGLQMGEKTVQFYVAEGLELKAGDEFKFRYLYRFDLGEKTVPVTAVNAGIYYPVMDGNNQGNIVVAADGTYDVYVTTDLKYFYFMPAGVLPEEAAYVFPPKPENAADWSISGTFVGWGDWWMVEKDGYYVAEGVQLSGADRFKFRFKEGWDQNRGGAGIAETDCWYAVTQGGADIYVAASGTYDIYLSKTLDKFYLMSPGAAPSEAKDGSIGFSDWSVSGDFNQWGDARMKIDGNFYVAKNVRLTADGTFKFKKGDWAAEKAALTTVYADKYYSVTDAGYGQNTVVGETGAYDIYLSVSLDRMYLMKAGTPISEATEGNTGGGSSSGGSGGTAVGWNICGSFTNDWQSHIDLVEDGSYYAAYDVTVGANASFKFRNTIDGNAWGEVRTANATVSVNTRYTVTNNMDGEANTKIAAAGTYDFYLSKDLTHFYLMEKGKKPGQN